MNISEEIRKREEMAINGWDIWDNIIADISDVLNISDISDIADISDISDIESTAYFVVIEEEDFSVFMIDELIKCFVNTRKIENICIISNFYDEKNLMCLGKNIYKFKLSEYEIDCLLAYYAICEFSECFYVFSFHRMGRHVPQEFRQELSKFEIAAAGILKMTRSEIEGWHYGS